MPRDGSTVYSAPAGTKGVPDTPIESAKYNTFVDDLVQDLNNARPIGSGGTGAKTAEQARINLGALAAADLLAAATKAAPVDNDGIVITDSEDSGKIKRVLWSVIKDKLKAFFDPIYQRTLDAVGAIELNSALTANTDTLIDFHSSYPSIDFDFRIIRRPGINGAAELYNNGAGGMAFKSAGGGFSFDKDLIVSGAFQTNAGSVNIQANDGAGNAHTWYRNVDGAWRVVTYADKDNGFHISAGRGTATFDFASNGTFVAPGTVAAAGGAAYLNTDGNVYGPRWLTWGSPYAFDATNARIEQRADEWATLRANNAVANRPTGDRVSSVGFWDGDSGRPYFNYPGVGAIFLVADTNLGSKIGAIGAGGVGSTITATSTNNRGPGDVENGANLRYSSSAGGAPSGAVGGGSFRCMGYSSPSSPCNWTRYS